MTLEEVYELSDAVLKGDDEELKKELGDVLLHIVTSFSRALITLGWLQKPATQKALDRAVWVLGAAAFCLAAFAVVRTQCVMFLH